MGPGYFLIAILGCGEADAPCQQVRMLTPHYESQSACVAATENALISNSDVDFPVVTAQCVAGGAKPASLNADEVLRPAPSRPALQTASLENAR
jgi:hypothetical protein